MIIKQGVAYLCLMIKLKHDKQQVNIEAENFLEIIAELAIFPAVFLVAGATF